VRAYRCGSDGLGRRARWVTIRLVIFFVIMVVIAVGAVIVLIRMK
jgi:hypothetical protein